MNRRELIKYLAATALFSSGVTRLPSVSAATHGIPRTLVNIMLIGGADLRFLFTPNPELEPEYTPHFAKARNNLYPGASFAGAWKAGSEMYLKPNDANVTFGIHKNAAWLLDQYNKNNVAIICNVAASENRRHDHSQLIVNSGDLSAKFIDNGRDGWGGRLVESVSDANVVSVTRDVSVFCNGTNAELKNKNTIHLLNARKASLSEGLEVNSAGNIDLSRRALGSALKSYYALKRQQVSDKPDDWIYHKFLRHEGKLRKFSELLNDRFNLVAPELPLLIRELAGVKLASDTTFDTTRRLSDVYFGQQCATLYDSLVASSLLGTRVVSMEYPGWDTHVSQRVRLERNFSDLFGTGKGLDSLNASFADTNSSWINGVGDINNNVVYMFTSDFGRQLKANGSAGTDHGRGTYVILVGNSVRGGVYGEMFPKSEIADLGNGTSKFQKQGADIQGLTSIERIFARACDWVQPGTGKIVMPTTVNNNLNAYPDGPALENGVDLTNLFSG